MVMTLGSCHKSICTCLVAFDLMEAGYNENVAWEVALFLAALARELDEKLAALGPEPIGRDVIEELLGAAAVREIAGEARPEREVVREKVLLEARR